MLYNNRSRDYGEFTVSKNRNRSKVWLGPHGKIEVLQPLAALGQQSGMLLESEAPIAAPNGVEVSFAFFSFS